MKIISGIPLELNFTVKGFNQAFKKGRITFDPDYLLSLAPLSLFLSGDKII